MTLLCCAQYFLVLISDAHISTTSKSELDAEAFPRFTLTQKGKSPEISNSNLGLLNQRRIAAPNSAYTTAPTVPIEPSHSPANVNFS